ncbi:Protein CHUP1, chloroplastic [Vitis vinifera]|uniref:Protein CHUP1, chloroplastic n=1 Tax=Vitis vinifera TaxID=29760 RepID=A0A438BWY8_VITVI|nr:Protein CHUP1, chloroplastic [Vitis vinifera]
MSRLNEVEELVYLRWVNSCLRNELRNSCSVTNSDKTSSPNSIEGSRESDSSFSCQTDDSLEYSSIKRLNLIKKLKKWPIISEDLPNLDCPDNLLEKSWVDPEEGRSPRRRHSISGSKCSAEDLVQSKRRQSDGFMCPKEMEKEAEPLVSQKYELAFWCPFKWTQRDGFGSNSTTPSTSPSTPPPPKFSARSTTGIVQRAPQVVEFYHSLMKRDSRKDSSNGGIYDTPDVANVRSNMIGEIENRSSYLLAIKADVETQGEFVNSLIREVNNAVYQNIEDVVAFVKWLDDELCFLVDERAVLKHFDWPEKKADTLREAAFGYRDLKKLESEVSYYKDDPRVPCDIALKKMVALSEEIKFGSVKLAKKYMRRVAMELQSKGAFEKDPAMDYMLLQGFAGGFDVETMHAFEELRNLAHLLNKKYKDQKGKTMWAYHLMSALISADLCEAELFKK